MAVIYHSLDCGSCSFSQCLEQDSIAKPQIAQEAKCWLSNRDFGNKHMRPINILTLKNFAAEVG